MKRCLAVLVALFLFSSSALAETAVAEAFGRPILKSEFEFAQQTMRIFSTSKTEPKNDLERRAEAFKHLIFLREAEKRGIEVSRADLEAELGRLLQEKNIVYNSYQYHQFLKDQFGEEAATFERRIQDLLKVKRMLDGILNPPKPNITEADARQKFLNQYNSMATEFVNFPTREEAEKFYKNISKKKWDEKKKADPKFATPTGHISLEALIDLWQVPTQDAYRIHKLEVGRIAAPAKMYKGYGVFRVLEKKNADMKDYTPKKKEEYFKVLEQVYYYNKTQKVIQDIFTAAAFKDYENDKVVTVETTQGTFELQLYTAVAPKAVENFTALADKGYYDGLLFHRVIKGFMIQGGDPKGDGTGGESVWGKPFEDEVNKDLQFDHGGLLAMANSGPNTNGSQFFITLGPALHLNMKHTIFGEVITGFETVQKIGAAETGPDDRPKTDQRIVKMRVKKWPTEVGSK